MKVVAKHTYVSAQADSGDNTKVNASDWNESHALDGVVYENGNSIAADYTIPVNTNAMSAGPITIEDGVTVTVSSGANWVIL